MTTIRLELFSNPSREAVLTDISNDPCWSSTIGGGGFNEPTLRDQKLNGAILPPFRILGDISTFGPYEGSEAPRVS